MHSASFLEAHDLDRAELSQSWSHWNVLHNNTVFNLTWTDKPYVSHIPAKGRQHRSTVRRCKRDMMPPGRRIQTVSYKQLSHLQKTLLLGRYSSLLNLTISPFSSLNSVSQRSLLLLLWRKFCEPDKVKPPHIRMLSSTRFDSNVLRQAVPSLHHLI